MNQRIRVLIADDQQPIRQGLKALLNYVPQIEVIDEAVNGEDAVRLAAKYQPDVVLMDMQMPLMDGIQATRLIKARWPQVRVIALTIYPRYQSNAIRAGADAFLLKGCTVEKLQTAIFELSDLEVQ